MISKYTTMLVLCVLAMVVLVSSNAATRELAETSSISTTASVVSNAKRWVDEKCDKSSIQINQAQTAPLPSGIPTYTVEIVNTCVSGCIISNIHVACGKFSSVKLINPRIFRRLSYDDCLVNDGKPFPNGHVISFQYANTYSYPLHVSSLVCHQSPSTSSN